MMELNIGDVTFMSRFDKVAFTEANEPHTFGFRPHRGKKFVVLLLGEVDKKAIDAPAEAMLNELGFFRRTSPEDTVPAPRALQADDRVPDDFRNQASGYRAGWNDCLAALLGKESV